MDLKQISIEPTHLDCERLLSHWGWLLPDGFRPFSLSLFGDWFFEDECGRIHFLDTVGGELTEIAPTLQDFIALRELPENLDNWYMADLAVLCLERKLKPQEGQCLGFKILPVIGGPLSLDNIEVYDLMVYEGVTAQIHRGVKELPEGTRIERFVVDGDEV